MSNTYLSLCPSLFAIFVRQTNIKKEKMKRKKTNNSRIANLFRFISSIKLQYVYKTDPYLGWWEKNCSWNIFANYFIFYIIENFISCFFYKNLFCHIFFLYLCIINEWILLRKKKQVYWCDGAMLSTKYIFDM